MNFTKEQLRAALKFSHEDTWSKLPLSPQLQHFIGGFVQGLIDDALNKMFELRMAYRYFENGQPEDTNEPHT